jgi:fructose/tagatose bisphosphate aldolase
MPVVSAKEMLLDATERRYAVGAFNVTSLVQMKAAIEATSGRKAPVIVQTSVKPSQHDLDANARLPRAGGRTPRRGSRVPSRG